MATFVLVHGGGHGGWCWKPLAALLRGQGHDVHAPTLTGLGERRHLLHPEIDLYTHVEDVVSLIFHEDLQDVVLVGHSYGGMVITGVADRMAERIAWLVYLDAAIPADGETLVDGSPGVQAFLDARVVDGVELGLWPEEVSTALYGITDAEMAAWAAPRLSPHPLKTFKTPLRLANPGALAQLPRAIINCPQTIARRPVETLDRWLEGAHVREIDTGHDVMLTEPEALAGMLAEIVA